MVYISSSSVWQRTFCLVDCLRRGLVGVEPVVVEGTLSDVALTPPITPPEGANVLTEAEADRDKPERDSVSTSSAVIEQLNLYHNYMIVYHILIYTYK